MEEIENEVVEMIEDTTDKELVQLINVECELGKIKEEFEKNGKTQLQINIMMDEEEDYDKLLSEVDGIRNMEEKFVRVRSLLDHKYLNAVSNWE